MSNQARRRNAISSSCDAVEVALDPLIVNRDDIAQSTRCILGHGGFLLLTTALLAPAK
jgi:hypothetical protein